MHPDDMDFHYSTDTEWDRAEAYQLGGDNPNRAWVLTDRDVWHKNPFYKGPPVPHPELDEHGFEDGDYCFWPRVQQKAYNPMTYRSNW